MPSVEVKVEDFYRDVQREKRNHFLLLILGLVLIVASITIVSIEKRE
jgi:hypothetical protein